ncbi:Poly [ADP-ribose] polymerase 9 [Merluccius polli]|uniref:Poly [ADP-ribose] polymerase 9 n=1 Tax=Merluccius polli TaxID=89951 RepID=A0AA47MJU5_MERPO|nr:Poly [ADP-ribose] polymerase 9 [Merluccius polli]
MANQLKIPLDRNKVSIVRQCGPAIKDVLRGKYECSVDFIGMDSVRGQAFGQSRNPSTGPEKRFSIKLKTIEVSVWKADLTKFPVDAVVNAANEDLAHYGGLANALSTAGGPEIQRESDAHVRHYGRLQTGDAVVCSPGLLECQKIIHAVGPWLPPGPSRYEVLQAEPLLVKTVNNILKMAEQNNLKSVAIPALSSGLFNFPVEKCADIIVDTLRNHNERANPGSYPCDIRLVNHDDPTVKEMERACRKIFGGTDVPVVKALQSHTSSATTPSIPLVIQIGNVRLTLSKGHIQRQKTDVIVNSTGGNLRLSNGTVSNAILSLAGEKMQEEMDQKYKKQPNKPLPPVLETKAYGLGCKQVYHTLCVGKEMANAKQILSKAVQECLQLAVTQRHKSIAFPAIGTGCLNFTNDEVADIMTQAVEVSARTMPAKMDVHFVIYPPERDTFMAFEGKLRQLQGRYLRPLGFETALSQVLALKQTRRPRGWLENLFHCSGMATVNNNFIQYLGVEELQKLNGDAKPNTSIEEFFERGCAKIKIQAESPEDAIVHVLKAEAMLCAVQEEFAREVKAHVPMPSAGVPVDFNKSKLHDFERLGLHVKKILKVDHPALMEAFELKKKQMGSSAPPRLMYQRIPAQFCSMLTSIGFQREYAPPDGMSVNNGGVYCI